MGNQEKNSVEKFRGSSLGERLRYFIEEKGLNLSEFRERVGLDNAHLHRILKGSVEPRTDTFEKLLKAFPNLSLTWLVSGHGLIELPSDELLKVFREKGKISNLNELVDIHISQRTEYKVLSRAIGSVEGSTPLLEEILLGNLVRLQQLRLDLFESRFEYAENEYQIHVKRLQKRIDGLIFLFSEDAKNIFSKCFDDGKKVWERWIELRNKELVEEGGTTPWD